MPQPEAALLAEVPMFQALDEAQRDDLAAVLELEVIPAGRTLLKYGDPGGSMYVIRAGEAEVFIHNDTGEKMVLEQLKPGDFFGEIALLANTPRTASVAVTKNLEALRLDRDDLERFLQHHPTAALDLLNVMARRLHTTGERLRHTATRNVNEETEDKRTTVEKVADWIAWFSGSMLFLYIHIGLFALWIIGNNLLGKKAFDAYPYQLLTMSVSLEAIFLSVFVLLSQNRQAEKDRVRADIEYDVNLKAEMEIAHLHTKVDQLRTELLTLLSARDGSSIDTSRSRSRL